MVAHLRMEPTVNAAQFIAQHLSRVLTDFTHRISNAVTERHNSRMPSAQGGVCGDREPDHFKIATYIHVAGWTYILPL